VLPTVYRHHFFAGATRFFISGKISTVNREKRGECGFFYTTFYTTNLETSPKTLIISYLKIRVGIPPAPRKARMWEASENEKNLKKAAVTFYGSLRL
jgi:hypothetical protein